MKYEYQYFIRIFLTAVIVGLQLSSGTLLCCAENVSQGEKAALEFVLDAGKMPVSSKSLDKEKERSPFQPSSLIEDYAGGYSTQFTANARWKLNIIVRGFIEIEGELPAVLLEINDEGVFVVSKGNTITLPHGAKTINLSIHEIHDSEVLVKIMPFDRIISVR